MEKIAGVMAAAVLSSAHALTSVTAKLVSAMANLASVASRVLANLRTARVLSHHAVMPSAAASPRVEPALCCRS